VERINNGISFLDTAQGQTLLYKNHVVQYLVNGPEWNVQTRVQQPIVAQKKNQEKKLNTYTPRLDHTYMLLVLKSQIPVTFLGRK
jgi:hypothetical protein